MTFPLPEKLETLLLASRWQIVVLAVLKCSVWSISGTAFGQVIELPPIKKVPPAKQERKNGDAPRTKVAASNSSKQATDSDRVADAEKRANFTKCIDGRYPALCKHELLTQEQLAKVDIAEKRANLRTCLDGRYPALCKHSLLSSVEAEKVLVAEKRENLKVCLDGRYPALCKHDLLDASSASTVAGAERRRK